MTLLRTASIPRTEGIRPRDSELDLFGLTHVGHVRKNNQDHFLMCTVHPQVQMHWTSLPNPDALPLRGERLATIMLVADGVGGSAAGAEASQLAAESVMRYVASTLRCYHAAGSANEGEFEAALQSAATEAHTAVRTEATALTVPGGMATTLTLAIVIWPWVYVVQVGDSRCYQFVPGKLRQVTRDQTMAQSLVDQGVLSADKAANTPFSNVLTSAIGGETSTPEVTRLDIHDRDSVVLLCSDGLTKHVTDDEIASHLEAMTSSEQACHALLELALDRGGSDNITIVVATAPQR
ncbi:MAG: protein phosphatase 2C domain-containing protein [Gemmatimonadota bacterium]